MLSRTQQSNFFQRCHSLEQRVVIEACIRRTGSSDMATPKMLRLGGVPCLNARVTPGRSSMISAACRDVRMIRSARETHCLSGSCPVLSSAHRIEIDSRYLMLAGRYYGKPLDFTTSSTPVRNPPSKSRHHVGLNVYIFAFNGHVRN
jgi:hypothetical protein